MALSAKVGTVAITTGVAGSPIAVTDVGFQPKALLFWWNGRDDAADAAGTANHRRGIGWAISTTGRRVCFTQSQDAQLSSVADRAYREDACIGTLTTGGAVEGLADLQSLDAGGFTLVIDDAFATAFRVHYLALGGDDLTNTAVGTFQEPVGTGAQDVTDVGFEPACVLFASIVQTAAPPNVATASYLMIGAATGPAQAATRVGWARDAQATMDTFAYCRSGECIGHPAATTMDSRATFDNFLVNGFRLNWVERDAFQRQIFYLALKGGRYAVGDLLTQTDTVTPIVETGLGVGTPVALLFVSAGHAQSAADTVDAHDEWSVGAATRPTERAAMSVLDEDGVADSDITTGISYDAIYQNLSDANVVEGEMDLTSLDSDGFTCLMDDADPSAAFVWYVAVGAQPTVVASVHRRVGL